MKRENEMKEEGILKEKAESIIKKRDFSGISLVKESSSDEAEMEDLGKTSTIHGVNSDGDRAKGVALSEESLEKGSIC